MARHDSHETKTIDIRVLAKSRPAAARPAPYPQAIQTSRTGSGRRLAVIAIVAIAVWLLWRWF